MSELEFHQHENGVRWADFPLLRQCGLRHGISTRVGGVSMGDLSGLNLGIKVGDSPANIQVNRRLFCETQGIGPEKVVFSCQVHGNRVAVVGEAQAGQRLADTDALVTRTPDLGLMLFFADCVPLLLFDPVRRIIGLSHAGWRGTFQSIGPRTISVMQQTFGTNPADCLAGIGPSIGPDDYETDKPVMEEIQAVWPQTDRFSRANREGHWLLDLWGWNRLQLEAAGVSPQNIRIAGHSTARESNLFFSHRASGGKAGRFGVLMAL